MGEVVRIQLVVTIHGCLLPRGEQGSLYESIQMFWHSYTQHPKIDDLMVVAMLCPTLETLHIAGDLVQAPSPVGFRDECCHENPERYRVAGIPHQPFEILRKVVLRNEGFRGSMEDVGDRFITNILSFTSSIWLFRGFYCQEGGLLERWRRFMARK